jgi:hypothetical protein
MGPRVTFLRVLTLPRAQVLSSQFSVLSSQFSVSEPPNDLPAYRILTGPDDDAFCHRVSEALALGYQLYGSPAATFDGEKVIVAQALIWPDN